MTPPENKPTKPTLWEQAKAFLNSKPWGFLGWLIAILLTVWLFFAGQRNPLLTYAVWPIHAPIVQSQSFSDLKVLYKGVEVHGDISLASVEFKNLGAGPILGAPDTDILSPIYIQLEGDAPILEASVQKMTRSVIEVSLDQSKASSGRLGLGWKILEQNDGFVVQITYVGPTNTNIQVTGTVKGQQQGLQEQRYLGIWTTTKEYNTSKSLYVAEIILIFFGGLISFVSAITFYHSFGDRGKLKKELEPEKLRLIRKKIEFRLSVLTAIPLVCVIYGIWLWVTTK
ncbi:MAG: hypothetical protein WAK31_03990 [Chthoniobacterales bacterium]